MNDRENRGVRSYYDIVLIGVYAVVSPAIGLLADGSAVRFLIAFPLVFFVPGYLLMVALFPADGSADHRGAFGLDTAALGPTERIALSFGLSIAVLPLFALLVWSVGIGAAGLAITVFGVFIVGLAVVAGIRRLTTPPATRYTPAVGGVVGRATSTITRGPLAMRVVSAALAIALISSAVMFAIVLAAPQDGEAYTEVMVGSVDDDGEFVLAEYPSVIADNESATYALRVVNREDTAVSYDLTVEFQQLEGDEVVERETVETLSVDLDVGEADTLDAIIEPPFTGEELRLAFQLEAVDAHDTVVTQETVHIWVTVTNSTSPASPPSPPMDVLPPPRLVPMNYTTITP